MSVEFRAVCSTSISLLFDSSAIDSADGKRMIAVEFEANAVSSCGCGAGCRDDPERPGNYMESTLVGVLSVSAKQDAHRNLPSHHLLRQERHQSGFS